MGLGLDPGSKGRLRSLPQFNKTYNPLPRVKPPLPFPAETLNNLVSSRDRWHGLYPFR